MDPTITYDVADGVGTITFARPASMNALDVATKALLREAVLRAAGDESVRCVLLTGTGRAFCVGQDLREHAEVLAQDADVLWRTVADDYNPMALALATMPKPVVAGVNGVAAGAGAALAMAADLRVVAESAGFNMAFAAIGLSGDSGSSWWLPRLVGTARAQELLMLPRTVGSAEALAIGLATEVVPDDQLAARSRELAAQLAAGPTLAYAAIRQAVVYSATHDLEASLANEARLITHTGHSQDHRDAVASFMGKTPARFHGR